MIKCLPQEVQEKLRSGVAIFSLQQCIEELVVNSIDAAATCVGVRLDMEAYKVQVIDNGTGMALEDMQHVGNRYFTSKCSSIEDLDNLRFYGYRGEAVASLVSLAMLVEISSRTKLSMKTRVKVFKDGKGLDVYECETSRPSAGTTVVICNFFHNMPVRRKRMDAVLECERIRHRVEAISLMHPSVSFTLKNDCTGAMVVQLSKARNTYYRFVQIHGLGRAQKLREIHHTHGQFEVGGYIGREGHYNNSLQYLYVNDRLLLKTRIHKLMNLLLRKVSVSNVRNDSPEAPSTVRSPKQRRGGELHGTYVINVKCPYSEYDVCLEPAKTLVEFKDWEGVLFCIEEAVKSFLTRENLVSELYPEDLEDASPRLFSAAGRGRPEDSPCQEAPRALGVAIPECTIGKTLASESVHRRPSGASAPKQITQKRKKDLMILKPWNSGTSLAAKLSLLQQRRGEVHTATLMEPSGPPSNEERPDLNHNQEGPSDTHSEPPSKEERPDLNHNQEGPSDTHSEPPSNEERPDLNHNQEGPSDTHSEPPSNEERPDLNHNQEGPRDTHSEPPSNEDRPDLNHNQEGPSDTHSEPPSNEERPDTGPTERCEAGAPGDWVSLYDDVVGKMVYVNRMTGLSRYQQPTVEDTHACCTSDLTNMAASVCHALLRCLCPPPVGMEYRCYPFPMDLVLPFLPKPRAERGLSSGPVHPGDTETSNSLSSVFCEWTNPVFVRPPKVGVDVSSGQAEGLAVKIHNILFPYRFSKDMIHSMKVIHQVDKKFLACLINTRNPEVAVDSSVEGNLLVLVDQHAAHERVRLESLVADAYEEDPEAPGERRLRWSTLSPPLEVELGEEETRLLRSCQTFLRGLGLKLQFTSLPAEEPKVLVAKVPVCFTEKEGSELRRGRQSVIKPIVQEYLREQIEVLRFTGRVRGTLPLTILKVLASIACHGAIKFNDSLSREECCSLVGCLSVCQLPFQCAHGRPSIAPLVDFLHLESCPQEPQKPNLQKLRRLQRAWELYGNR
ncbi:DNA mismatch repair protein Mlh3 [Aplochiton taeniatus]